MQRVGVYRCSVWLVGLVGLVSLMWHVPQAEARDVRLALLVGNQQGWSGDPRLNYVLKGDLRPMAQTLRQIGFYVVSLENRNADTLRRAFEVIRKRMKRHPKVTTFLFYYSGHADKQYFHLGPRGERPFSYQEFRRNFYSLHSLRRIAIIDACHSGQIVRVFGSEKSYRTLLKRGFPKGVRGQRKPNLIRLLRPSQGNEKGLRVIGSSRFLSWEIQRYQASVFTYHLLQGLRGSADLNRDGKIALDELFDFTRQSVYRDTGQRPQQFKRILEGEPYAFAPAYRSRLRIDAQVVGKLKVSVNNFVWYKTKHAREPLRIAMVPGTGEVYLKRGGRCWRQPIKLPPGGEGRLYHHRWLAVSCRWMTFTPKGSVEMVARRAPPMYPRRDLVLSLSSGYLLTGSRNMEANHLAWSVGLRWRYLGVGLEYGTGFLLNKQFLLHRLAVHFEAGWPFHYARTWLFLGVYTRLGTTLQTHPDANTHAAISLGGGGLIDLTWWWSRHWGMRGGARIGFDYTPVVGQTGLSPFIQANLALLFAL